MSDFDFEKELKEIYEKSEKTELDKRLYEFNLMFLRELWEDHERSKEKAEKEMALPACFITIYDPDGNEVTGQIKVAAQEIYSRMFNAKDMINKTEGEDRKKWIQERKFWNTKLIEYSQQFPKYCFIPSKKTKED